MINITIEEIKLIQLKLEQIIKENEGWLKTTTTFLGKAHREKRINSAQFLARVIKAEYKLKLYTALVGGLEAGRAEVIFSLNLDQFTSEVLNSYMGDIVGYNEYSALQEFIQEVRG